MKAWCLILCLFACRAVYSGDLRVDKVLIHGASAFSSSELAGFLDLSTGDSISMGDLKQHLSNLVDSLFVRDFLFAGADSFSIETKKNKNYLQLYVEQGLLAHISVVRWHGDSLSIPKAVSSRAMTLPGHVFRWSEMQYDTKLLLDYFAGAGYPFARIEVEKLEPSRDTGSVEVWLRIMSGPYTKIEFISFSGNRQTDDEYLRRVTRLKLGMSYDDRKIEIARRHLTHLDFVRRVDKSELLVNPSGQTGVRFGIEESRSTRLDIVAGYQPGTANTSGSFNGLVDVNFLNLFGTGRQGRLYWSRPDQHIQTVEVAYQEPWILGQPISAGADFSQRIEDTMYVTRKISLQITGDLTDRFSVWGTISREEVVTDSLSAQQLGLPDSRTLYLESGVALDTRDHPTNPRGGIYFSTFAGTGWRTRDRSNLAGLPGGSFKQQRVGMDSETAFELFPFWIGDIALHARTLDSDEPEILLPDLYRLGGAKTLRGYREEQFLGSRIGWASAELRYWLGTASRIFTFFDAGSAYRKQSGVENTIFRMSTGIGLRLETSLGIWGFDYGIGQSDRVLDGKIHLSLTSTF